jgi:hypothetical protein
VTSSEHQATYYECNNYNAESSACLLIPVHTA